MQSGFDGSMLADIHLMFTCRYFAPADNLRQVLREWQTEDLQDLAGLNDCQSLPQ
jgi:hypothetical protein